jgi:ankyrin repeat protein
MSQKQQNSYNFGPLPRKKIKMKKIIGCISILAVYGLSEVCCIEAISIDTAVTASQVALDKQLFDVIERQGSVQEVKAITEAGANVNAIDNLKYTTLHRAAMHSDDAVIKVIVAAGADINVLDNYGNTALRLAAMYNSAKVVQTLVEAGADVNAVDNYEATALHFAATYNTAEVVKALIAVGAKVNVENREKRTPISLARMKGRSDIIKILIRADAE